MTRRGPYRARPPRPDGLRWFRLLVAAVGVVVATVLLVALGDDDDDDDEEDDRDDGHRAPRVVVTAPIVPGGVA